LSLTQHLNHPPTASELLYVCTKYFVQLSDFKILLLIFPKPHADVRLFFLPFRKYLLKYLTFFFIVLKLCVFTIAYHPTMLHPSAIFCRRALPHRKRFFRMIRILTDSASDLTATDSARPGVYTVPLSVTFADGTGGLDGVELTADEFYAHLKVDKVPPRTSQPSPQSFMTIFEDAKENGDQVIAILISSNLSGTYQCARLAAESCDFEDVFFVDSRTASQGEAILVREALRLRDEEHLPAHAIVAELEQLKQRIRVLAVVDSLKHLHKGGRLPAAVALVGGALGVKPVLSVVDGQIKLADTARGRPGAFVAMFKNIEKMGGVDPRYGYALLYSDEKGVLAPLHHYMHENLHMTGGRVARLGPVIASHAGPGCAGLVFVTKE